MKLRRVTTSLWSDPLRFFRSAPSLQNTFSRSGPFPAPSVSASSTAEGFRLFCAGPGIGTPDISNASRPISPAERTACLQTGVKQIAEIRIGYDSLIVANSVAADSLNLTLGQLWLAVAGRVPVGGRLIPNPYQSWSDIDPSLPHKRIKLLGPSVGHGTRDAFVELVMSPVAGERSLPLRFRQTNGGRRARGSEVMATGSTSRTSS